MAKPDRHFINVFSAVLGILVAIALALVMIARRVDSGPKGARDVDDPLMQASAHERIKPFGEVAVAGRDNTALAIRETPPVIAGSLPPAGAAPGAEQPTDGKSVFESACVACHGSGLAGAPRLGDSAEWSARIAKGEELLKENAVKGFQGSKGFMPPKGGRADLSDDAVHAAVDYMVSQSG